MTKEQFKEKVLAWLAENNLYPRKVRVFNTRRYGLEVRCYCPPMVYTSDRVSHRKVRGTEEVNNVGGVSYQRTTGHHEITKTMYININEEHLAQDKDDQKFTLDMVRDNCLLLSK